MLAVLACCRCGRQPVHSSSVRLSCAISAKIALCDFGQLACRAKCPANPLLAAVRASAGCG